VARKFLNDISTTTLLVNQPAHAGGGMPKALEVLAGILTSLPASTENIDVNIALARNVQFLNGALTTQRAILFQAPTYAFATTDSHIGTAATVAILGAPISGDHCIQDLSLALWVQSGRTRLAGDLDVKNVPYTWPTSNSLGVMTNDGTGVLGWNNAPVGVASTRSETQTLTSGQTVVTVTTITTEGLAVYIEGAREDEFTINSSTQITLTRSYPTGTKIFLVQNDPYSGVYVTPAALTAAMAAHNIDAAAHAALFAKAAYLAVAL